MTSSRPQRPNRSRRRPRLKHPDERHDTGTDFAGPRAGDPRARQRNVTSARAAREELSPPPRPRHRLPNPARPRRSRLSTTAVAGTFLAVVLVGGGAFFGIQQFYTRHSVRTPLGAQPTGSSTPATAPGTAVAAPPAPPGCADITSLLASMSPRDKLGQLLMVGVTDAADARRVVANQHVGGIFIGSWTDLSMLTDGALNDISGSAGPLGLAVSVDEEGGRVQRLSQLIGSAPSARVLAQTQRPEDVYQLALSRGRVMRKYGITVDFAPVVDVTNAPDATVIGDRSFSPSPAVVTQYAGAYAKGLRDARVLPVLKHFPGHGHASGDSHQTGVVSPPLDDLENVDLLPYQTLTAQIPVGVMVGHMQVPGLTGDDQASLSPAAYTLLRTGGYGGPAFNGPVFTDDLSSMKAITDQYGVAQAALKALQAGADTALWVTTTEVPAVLDQLQSALAGGALNIANIDASVRRMAAAKALNSPCGH
jgi:beta-N-acetylhexosaminidase